MGDGQYGELGVPLDYASYQNVDFPDANDLPGGPNENLSVVATAAGGFFSLFVLSDGTLWAMGDDSNGQLGYWLDTESGYNIPQQIASNVVAVAAGASFSLFLKSDGSLWGMGDNSFGQLGTGDYMDRHAPVEIVAPPPQISIVSYGADVILVWPANAAGFHLQAATDLTPAVWSTNLPAPVLIGENYEVFTPITGTQKFYRLSQ
jgi:alpha-tubulin suppressor-like RCC1 family protein